MCIAFDVLLRRLAIALLVLASCVGETSSNSRVQVVSGLIVDNGLYVNAVLNLHVDAAAQASTFAWKLGAVSSHRLCEQPLGWRLDVTGGPTEIGPNDAPDIVLRARSYDRVECDREPVARCGEPVTVFIMIDDDTVLATVGMTYECLFPL